MRRKTWLTATILPASLLAFCSAANAVDCTNASIVCNTFTKGSAKFKPVLSTGALNTCAAGGGTESISIKGTLSDCTVTGAAGVVVISGSVKGTLYTGDCTCVGLTANNAIKAPPIGKFNQLVTTWKFDLTPPNAACDSGQKSTTLTAFAADSCTGAGTPDACCTGAGTGNCARIKSGPFIASLANANFNIGAIYGAFTLSNADAPGPVAIGGFGVTGIFDGGDAGALSSLTGASTESLTSLVGTCADKGLKGVTF